MMFAGVVLYLIGAGAIGELQLLHVQADEHVITEQLSHTNAQNAVLSKELHYLQSSAGQAAAVRSELHYAPAGTTPLVIHTVP